MTILPRYVITLPSSRVTPYVFLFHSAFERVADPGKASGLETRDI